MFNPAYIIADHIRASCFIIADGVQPSGKQRGYILRRLIRRSLSAALKLKIDIANPKYFVELVDTTIAIYDGVYPELLASRNVIMQTLTTEAGKYLKAISTGQKEWAKILKSENSLDGQRAAELSWDLYQRAGVPFEVSEDILAENNIIIDGGLLEKLVSEHQEKSRTTSSGQFKSGLGENTSKTTRLHTATHILHQVLRSMFGVNLHQMGSAITSEKARFDFGLDHKIEEDEIKKIQARVQEIINQNLAMTKIETTESEARQMGAIGLFGEKYGDKVTVYSLTDSANTVFSREFCGGPHIDNTSEIGQFIILREKSVSAGVRRLEFDVV